MNIDEEMKALMKESKPELVSISDSIEIENTEKHDKI